MRAPSLGTLLILALLGALALAAPAAGQASEEALRGEIEALYRVEAASGGVELRPRESRLGVETITVAGDRVRINGAPVSDEVLRAWLGEQASLVLRLLALAPAERRRLFDLPLEAEPLEAPERPERWREEIPEPPEPSELPEPPELPELPWSGGGRRTGDQFTLFSDLEVGPGESAREAVAVLGSVRVLGEVRGDVTAVVGSVFVEGRVGGEVVAVNGSVHLGPRAEVLKGVTAVGGTVARVPGAVVRGAVTEVPYWGGARWDHPWGERGPRWWRGWWYPMGSLWSFYWTLIKLATLALLLSVVVLVAPRAVGRASLLAGEEWVKAALAGLLAVVLYLPAVTLLCVLLVLTIIGCVVVPLVVVAAVLLPFFFALAGYAASALCLGRWLAGRLGWGWTSPFAHVIVGMVALAAPAVLGELMGMAGPAVWPVSLLLDGLGFAVGLAATIVGIGALILARSRRGELPPAPAAAREVEPEAPAAGALAPIAVPPIEPAAGGGEEPSGEPRPAG